MYMACDAWFEAEAVKVQGVRISRAVFQACRVLDLQKRRYNMFNIWVVVKIMVHFWVPIIYGTYDLGYPKRDHNFDTYPYNRYSC